MIFSFHAQFVALKDRTTWKMAASLAGLIGGPENVRAAECTRRLNAKIGHSLFHRDDISFSFLYGTQRILGQKLSTNS